MDEIEPIIAPKLPFDPEDKIFLRVDDEGNIIGEPYSQNDYENDLKAISGVSEDLMSD